MSTSRRRLLALAPGLVLAARGQAQPRPAEYPSRPIRIIVPYSAGGGSDLHVRLIAEAIRPMLGQPIVVEVRPGANGLIGTEVVARAEPDGHTLVSVTGGHVLNKYAMPSMPFDPVRDFTPITMLAQFPMVLVGGTATPWADMAGLLAHARANPGAVSLGTTTAFNAAATTELSRMAGVDVTAVPYRGGGSMVVDLLAGRIGAGWASPQTAIAQMGSGRIRILAVAGEARSALLPAVPTMIESGVPGFVSDAWFGLLGPAGLPPAVVARLHAAIAQAMEDPAVRARVHEFGTDGRIAGPAEFAARLRADEVKWAEAARSGLLPRVE